MSGSVMKCSFPKLFKMNPRFDVQLVNLSPSLQVSKTSVALMGQLAQAILASKNVWKRLGLCHPSICTLEGWQPQEASVCKIPSSMSWNKESCFQTPSRHQDVVCLDYQCGSCKDVLHALEGCGNNLLVSSCLATRNT